MRSKVLFICVHNSARSQMAATLLNRVCGEFFEAESAGLELGTLNPFVVEALQEIGIDISKNKTQGISDVLKTGQLFSHVITVCSEAEATGCSIFLGTTKRLHWPFPDPSGFQGNNEAKLEQTRRVRDMIASRIEQWCAEACAGRAPAS